MRVGYRIALALVVVTAGAGAAAAQQTAEPSRDQARQLLDELGDVAFASPDPGLDLTGVDDALRQDLESMRFDGDPLGKEPARSVFGSNPLTGDRNPLIGEDERQRWLAQAIKSVGFDEVSAHLRQQAAAMRDGSIDRAGWYEHVAKCTKLCNPVVRGLLLEHVRQVAARPHHLVTFATNRSGLGDAAKNGLVSFVRSQVAIDEGVRFLLIGRASRTGQRVYNRELSARRVQSVHRVVAEAAVVGDRVSGFWLGYEPPQITSEIARAYRLPPALDDLARNQSVLVVAYRPQDAIERS